MKINTFDIDGVIYLGENYTGLRPGENDIIITGRSYEEKEYTLAYLHSIGIHNKVFFNTQDFHYKTRLSSGEHKANVIGNLIEAGYDIQLHFEDDEVQAEVIERLTPVKVVRIVHDLVEKENIWHGPTVDRASSQSD